MFLLFPIKKVNVLIKYFKVYALIDLKPQLPTPPPWAFDCHLYLMLGNLNFSWVG